MANLSDIKFNDSNPRGNHGPKGLSGSTGRTGPTGLSTGPFDVSTITSPHTLSTNEIGKLVKINAGVSTVGLNTITIPASTFSLGDTFLIFNETSPTQTISAGAGVTFHSSSDVANTANTIPQNGLCTVLCLNPSEFTFSGNFSNIPPTIPIIQDGLVVWLDAGNPNSYPGSGTTWFDLSGNGNHMTLTGSPSYLSSNGGVLSFNGSNQYGSLTGLNYSASTFTIIAASRYSGETRGRVISSMANNWLFGHWSSGSEEYYAEGWILQGAPNDTNWRIYAATENHSADQRSFYVNNTARVTNSTAGSQGFNGLSVGRWGSGASEYSTCEVSFIQVYSRILTTEELTQNYNTLTGRFQ